MKILKILYNGISVTLLVIILCLAILLSGVRLIGYTPYAVLSGSMEPLYGVGSIVYVKEVETSEIYVDDVITFYATEDTVVTHQVIDIDEENGLCYTKGLANDSADGSPVSTENIIGKVVYGIPYLGYVSVYVTSPPLLYIMIALILIWAIVVYMVDISKKDKS